MDSPAQASEGSGRQEPAKPATTRRRTGGRSARVRAQVLEAVSALLLEAGYDGLTVDAVAERAGVHRTTVYRRWGDVGRLLADVLDAASDDTWSPPDTGSLENDLTALNQEVYEALAGGGPNVTTALIAAGFRSAEAAAALSRFWEDRYARCAVVVTRAAARGELPGPADSRALLVAATAPLYHELLLLRTAPDPTLPPGAPARTGAFEGANSSRDW
ncbi:TetR/AcrR family transcriptional regulator [Streptomyces xanthophaeus]